MRAWASRRDAAASSSFAPPLSPPVSTSGFVAGRARPQPGQQFGDEEAGFGGSVERESDGAGGGGATTVVIVTVVLMVRSEV